jgi:hypothetical protein
MSSIEPSKLVDAIIHESEQVQSGIERTQNGNLMEEYGQRSLLMKLPINLFNIGVLAVLIIAHVAFVAGEHATLPYVTGSFIAAVIISTFAVMVEGSRLESDFRNTSAAQPEEQNAA